jgi:hypothetical protein
VKGIHLDRREKAWIHYVALCQLLHLSVLPNCHMLKIKLILSFPSA